MNPSDQNQTSQAGLTDQSGQPVHNPIAAMRENETVICQIRRHPFGLLGIHIMAGLILLIAGGVIYGVLPHVLTGVSTKNILSIGTLVFIVLAALVFLFLAVTHKVYWGNSWILTSDSLTQVTQSSLFDRQSSQLSLGNLEDVTAEQNGILAHMFNFGLLRVETAGERSKFMFPFCPDPNLYAKKVLAAREEFEQGQREPRGYQQPYQTPTQISPPAPAPASVPDNNTSQQ